MLTGYWIDGKEELAVIYEMRRRIFGYEVDEMDRWAKHLLILDEDEPVAVGSLLQNLHHIYELYDVGVLEEKRLQGIGGFTAKVLINDAWEHDAVGMELIADDKTEKFFNKLGFLRDLDGERETGSGRTGLYMSRTF